MKTQKIAKAYARAIIELGKEQNVDVAGELTRLNEVINQSCELETLLFLDVFTVDEKLLVLTEIAKRIELNKVIVNFLQFLLQEKRMGIFPLIFKDVIVMDDHEKGFLRGQIEGNLPNVNLEFEAKIKTYLKQKLGIEAHLDYVQNAEMTGGYKVTVEDLQLDASVDNQLNKFRETVLNN